ncbi:MAG: putative thioredoxin [Planctomycetota bacterium]|jgi:putative thioredoxin
MSTPTPADTTWVVDITTQSFETEILLKSKELPVVVGFISAKSGPCLELDALLQQVAGDAKGGFRYARVDADANPELVGAFRVQSVPTVVVVADGRMADGFQGPVSEAELMEFLKRVAPGLETSAAGLDSARELLAAEQVDDALLEVEASLAEASDNLEAHVLRSEILLAADRAEDAAALLRGLTDAQLRDDTIKAALARVLMAGGAGDLKVLAAAAEATPEDAAARTAYGKALLANADYEAGFEELLDAIRLAPEEKESAAKQAMLEGFDALGLEDPIANRFRFEMSLVLFA